MSQQDRLDFYTQGRPVRFSDFQLRVLELISKAAERGITQSDLSKALQMDPRNLFHQLKNLLGFQIITRLPVSYQKSFTYLLYLARFAPRDEVEFVDLTRTQDYNQDACMLPSVVAIRSRIMDIIQSAPGRTLPATEVYRLLGDLHHIRIYRRNISWLVCKGYIECFIAQELGGVSGKILKMKKSYSESDKRPVSQTLKVSNLMMQEKYSGAVKFLALERQIHDFIDAHGPRGVTLTEIMWNFGVDRKYAYRIGERLCGKVFSNSDIFKVAEFVGKERRHRFFTRSGQARGETSVSLEAFTSTHRDSITRFKRIEKLLQVVEEQVIVESGKPLVLMIQALLQEQEFQMDGKTLKRMVLQLEAEGRLRTFVVVLGAIHRLVITRADIAPDDPRVKEYIDNMKRSKSELSTAPPSPKPDSQTAGLLGDTSQAKNHKFKLQKYGYVFGIFQRCRLLHRYLIESIVLPNRTNGEEKDDPWLCETLPVFFRTIPLSLFLRIVGVGEMSFQLSAYLRDERTHNCTLDTLPPWVKEELHRRRVDRHKAVIKTLMDMLGQLGLSLVDNRYPSVAFRLPFQYRLNRLASVIDLNSQKIIKTISFETLGAVDEYWDWLAGLPDSKIDNVDGLPDVYKAACNGENWQIVSPFSRSFKKALRRVLDSTTDADQVDLELETLAADFDIDRDLVRREYQLIAEEVQRIRRLRADERRERRMKRDAPPPTPILPKPENSESDEAESTLAAGKCRKAVLQSFSESDLGALRLGCLILHMPPFKGPAGTIRWNLLSRISKNTLGTSEELRAFFARFQNSLEQSQKMLCLERNLQSVDTLALAGFMASPPTYVDESSIEDYFQTMFQYYQESIGRVEEGKRRLRAHQVKLLHEGADSSELSLGPLYKTSSIYDPEVLFKRMSRSQQFRYFCSTPYIIFAHKPPPYAFVASSSASWIAIKKTLAAPMGSYDSGQMKEYLSTFGTESIESCIREMISAGLLTRGDSVRFRLRVPGSDFLVHEQFLALVEGEERWEGPVRKDSMDENAGELDLMMENIRAAAAGRLRISFEMARGVPQVQFAPSLPRHAKRARNSSDTLSTVMKRHLDACLSPQFLWIGMRDEPRAEILRAACKYVYEIIAGHAGISLRNLQESCLPFLSPSEAQQAAKLLCEAGLIETEEGIANYYPKP